MSDPMSHEPTNESAERGQQGLGAAKITRRTVAAGIAWTVPALVLAPAAQAATCSIGTLVTKFAQASGSASDVVTFAIPAGAACIEYTIWGGGGRGGDLTRVGGDGSKFTGTLDLSGCAGDVQVTLIAGGGGTLTSGGQGYGNGGDPRPLSAPSGNYNISQWRYGGGGGGGSAILLGGTGGSPIVVAGGGGGNGAWAHAEQGNVSWNGDTFGGGYGGDAPGGDGGAVRTIFDGDSTTWVQGGGGQGASGATGGPGGIWSRNNFFYASGISHLESNGLTGGNASGGAGADAVGGTNFWLDWTGTGKSLYVAISSGAGGGGYAGGGSGAAIVARTVINGDQMIAAAGGAGGAGSDYYAGSGCVTATHTSPVSAGNGGSNAAGNNGAGGPGYVEVKYRI
ncbi:hypothetical protein ACWEOW_06610 [Monashia sp. NPDC004114]